MSYKQFCFCSVTNATIKNVKSLVKIRDRSTEVDFLQLSEVN